MKKITLLMILPFFLFAHSPSVLEYLAGGGLAWQIIRKKMASLIVFQQW